ncbi:MAG: heme exporter protein CcmD [Alphaproteobacteria bacterium]|nr:heme exporter protein CcmD [Alphaproteobacteria bacterium]MCY4318068.1 heme exporter protein CcmD [Alphaproteobacteria bacterium]
MSELAEFFHMGGYAAYVWPAYGATVVLLGGLLVDSVLRLRRAERRLAALRATEGDLDDAA